MTPSLKSDVHPLKGRSERSKDAVSGGFSMICGCRFKRGLPRRLRVDRARRDRAPRRSRPSGNLSPGAPAPQAFRLRVGLTGEVAARRPSSIRRTPERGEPSADRPRADHGRGAFRAARIPIRTLAVAATDDGGGGRRDGPPVVGERDERYGSRTRGLRKFGSGTIEPRRNSDPRQRGNRLRSDEHGAVQYHPYSGQRCALRAGTPGFRR